MMEILNYLAVNATSDTQCTLGNTTITKLFQILKTNKAFSPDKLNPALLKQALSELNLLAVLSVHNYSIFLIQSSAVPNQWKIANIITVCKRKDQQTQRATTDQYLCSVSPGNLNNFLHLNNMLTPCQSGFRSNDSTVN